MIGKLILTAIILGGGAFMLLSDDFLEFVTPYAGAAATDIENMKNDPATQAKFNNALEIISVSYTHLTLPTILLV